MYKRRQILDAVVDTLSGINPQNGYESDLRLVSKRFLHYDQCPEFPALFVEPGPGRLEDVDGSGAVRRGTLQVLVTGYAQVGEDTEGRGLLSDALESLIGDVTKAVALKPHLGLSFVNWAEVVSVDPYIDWDLRNGFCWLTIEVAYRFGKGEP